MYYQQRIRNVVSLLIMSMLCLASFAQGLQVQGIVKDKNGEPMIGVNVVVKGTTNGTITGIDGDFSLSGVKKSDVIAFTYIGFKNKEVKYEGQKQLNVILEEDTETLEEVVVIGYGTVNKRDLTGSVASVSAEDIAAVPVSSATEALTGKLAGVNITTTEGSPDADVKIRVRGGGSLSQDNSPLYIVDGFPVSSISDIAPSEIQSIDVLKDASSTAIYGARGANGVILVTTKKGESGKVNVEYSGYLSIGKVDNYRRVRNGAEYLEYLREAERSYIYDGEGGYSIDPSCGYPSMEPNWEYDQRMEYVKKDNSGYVLESVRRAWEGGTYDPSKLRTFDWQGAGMRDKTISHNHNISIRGGSKDTKVFLSGSFMDNRGITPRSFRKRYTLRLNLDQNLGKYITMGATTNFAYWEYFNGTGVGGNWNPLGTPYYSPGGEGDNYGIGGDVTQDGDPALGLVPHPTGEGMLWNPFYDFTGVQGKTKRNRIDATLYAMIKLDCGLSYRVNFGTDYYSGQEQSFYAKASTQQGFGNSQASQKAVFDRGWTLEHILSYVRTFGQHSINLTAVQSSQKIISEPLSASGLSLPLETQLYYNLGGATTQSATSGFTQWTMMSWMGRAIYGFKDNRYMLTASLRYDGSSRLADGHKWVAFPSVAVAWRISDEAFIKDHIDQISNLKLRFGYGKTGNSSVNPYETIGKISSSRYTWGAVGMLGYAPSSLSNNSLTWETTGQYNVGLDFGFFNGRISGSIEWYKQHTYDLLMPRALPEVSGFGSITENVGETENRGFEMTLETVNFQTKDFSWTTSLQFATNKEQIVKLASGQKEDTANMWFVGHPVDTHYNYVSTKYVWGYSKEDMAEMAKFNEKGANFKPGSIRLEDVDGDYKITEEDKQILGSVRPKFVASMVNNFEFKGFDLSVFLYASVGGLLRNNIEFMEKPGRGNTVKVDYWTSTNPTNAFPRPSVDVEKLDYISTLGYEGGFPQDTEYYFGLYAARNVE